MLDQLGTFFVQGSLTGGIGGLIVYLLTLPQRRRRISASATVEESNAASTLSGEALRWVEEARTRARAAELRAEELAGQLANDRAAHRRELDERDEEIDGLRERVRYLEAREGDLERTLAGRGIEVPPRRRAYDERPPDTPTVDDVPPPSH